MYAMPYPHPFPTSIVETASIKAILGTKAKPSFHLVTPGNPDYTYAWVSVSIHHAWRSPKKTKKRKKKTQKENYDLPFQNFQSNFQPEENGNLPSRW